VKGAHVFFTAAIALCLSVGVPAQRWGADYFPNVLLTTHNGEVVRFYDDLIKGKIVAVNLIYTTCKYACPLETARLRQVQKLLGDRMGRDVFFYSLTIDPDHDTPEVLKEYARQYDAGPGWLFLTGTRADIDLVSARLGLNLPTAPTNLDGHTPSLMIGNAATGQWMRNSAVASPSFLARTIGDWLNSWQSAPKAVAAAADAPSPSIPDRQQVTFARQCSACHTIGGGNQLGPDLAGVTMRRDRAWLTQFITAPDRMNAAGDPTALALRAKYKDVRMPNLGLNEAQATSLVDYIERQSAAADARRSVVEPTRLTTPPVTATVIPAALLTPYLRVQQALFNDRLDGIKESAEAISAAASQLSRRVPAVVAVSGSLQRAADLTAARLAFAALNELLIGDGKTFQSERDDVHVAYCPMARKYWLQAGQAIQNPFYGQKMPDCGRIVAATDR
jgi:protein SCO1/2